MINYAHDFKSYLRDTAGLSTNSLDAYSRDIRLLMTYFDDIGIKDIKSIHAGHLEHYLEYLKLKGSSASTIARHLASQRRFFKYLNQTGLLDSQPQVRVERPKVAARKIEILSKSQVARLIETPDLDSDFGLRDVVMIKMLYETGIKVSELVNLNCEDINFKKRTITLKNQPKHRALHLSRDTAKLFKKYLKTLPYDYEKSRDQACFINCYKSRLTRQGFWKLIKRNAELAQITGDIKPHTLRHSFAVHQLQEGVAVEDLQTKMGHVDISSTLVYENYIKQDIG